MTDEQTKIALLEQGQKRNEDDIKSIANKMDTLIGGVTAIQIALATNAGTQTAAKDNGARALGVVGALGGIAQLIQFLRH